MTGGGSAKENDLKKTLDKLVKNAEAIDGVNKITFDELFNTGFMKKHTRFSSIDELFRVGGISVNSADDLNAILCEVVTHCAAYTAADKAEAESTQANIVNDLGIRNLALVCKELDIPLARMSTDYVLSGERRSPWRIFDERNPVNVYGYSKYLGERYLESVNPKHYFVRTSWLFGAGRPNFVNTMLRLATSRSELHVVNDQFGCPTSVPDLAVAIGNYPMKSTY